VVGAGGIRHHEDLLEGGECGAELLRHPGDGPVEGVAAAGAGTRSRSITALGAVGVLVGPDDETLLGGPLRGPARGDSSIIP
jgi:hypothetical protein